MIPRLDDVQLVVAYAGVRLYGRSQEGLIDGNGSAENGVLSSVWYVGGGGDKGLAASLEAGVVGPCVLLAGVCADRASLSVRH